MTPISGPRFSKQNTCATPGIADSAAVRSAQASMIVRTLAGARSANDASWSELKHTTSHRPAAGRACQMSSPSTAQPSVSASGRARSAGKRFSNTTTS